MATMNCKWCIETDHEGDEYCGIPECACCGENGWWNKNRLNKFKFTKYNYLCTNCDTLIEVTTAIKEMQTPSCFCSSPTESVLLLSQHDATLPPLEYGKY